MKREVLRLENISKALSESRLCNINLNLYGGEILGLLARDELQWEMLGHIIDGSSGYDCGKFYVNDCVLEPHSRLEARKAGIYKVSKKPQLIDQLSVAENLFIQETRDRKGIWINKKEQYQRTKEALEELGIPRLRPGTKVYQCSLSTKHLIEVIKAYVNNGSILLIEDITENYLDEEKRRLKDILQYLAAKEMGILMNIHPRNNLTDILDRVAILREATIVSYVQKQRIREELLVKILSGGEHNELRFQKVDVSQKMVLNMHSLKNFSRIQNISLKIYGREILGIFDCTGEHMDDLTGIFLRKGKIFGRMEYGDREFFLRNEKIPEEIKIGIVPENKDRNDVFYNLDLKDNVTLVTDKKLYSRFGMINGRIQNYLAKNALGTICRETLMEEIGAPKNLPWVSLGTQLCILLAKWINAGSRIIVIMNPHTSFNGMDDGEFCGLLRQVCSQEVSVLIISTNWSMLTRTCDRIITIENGRVKKDSGDNSKNGWENCDK